MRVTAIIPVAGSGKRFGGDTPKQYLALKGEPIIAITVRKFLQLKEIYSIIVVTAADEIARMKDLLGKIPGFNLKAEIVTGGKERQDSVENGLQKVDSQTDIILVHDGVRPLISHKIILNSLRESKKSGACVVAVPVKDTIKRVENNKVLETLPRELLYQIQTPQTFLSTILTDAHKKAKQQNFYATDEAALVEWAGYPVSIVAGDYRNIKITTVEDLKIAEIFMRGQK